MDQENTVSKQNSLAVEEAERNTWLIDRSESLGPDVQKLVNANPGLIKVPIFLVKRVFKTNFNWPFNSKQSQNIVQKRFTKILIAWL